LIALPTCIYSMITLPGSNRIMWLFDNKALFCAFGASNYYPTC
jgi:hypothetical protein